ncbi:unnamed protein product, partial [Rotaria sp. Silwood1]
MEVHPKGSLTLELKR